MSSEPKYTRLYIALYDTEGGNGKYHWALIIHDPWLRLSKRISLYQIRRTRNDLWALSASNNARLLARNTLLCLVELPRLTISPSLARRFFAAQSPSQGTTPLLPGEAGWSGAQWVIRCLDQAVQLRYFYSSLPDYQSAQTFYRYISLSKGQRFEGAKYGRFIFDPTRSHEILGTVIDGVHVLDARF
ncbi:hypothetical protein EDD18DRAFT_157671 [Armillaria luteobubalina]|uniref:Uncharacterized protein n=1 Tax=Armillaria luteobubalina TaxID=153913 RepID=A0AA39Q8Y0_9AGAR|nr:hypothetical protein EDD18DRAFT_157671 [Armillaria luteobubalina]